MRLISLMFLFIPMIANADLYKCKDASGKIAYQQTPCEAATIGKIKRDTTTGDPDVVAKRKAEAEQFNARYLERKKTETDLAEKKQKEEREERNLRAQEDQARALEDQAAVLRAARAKKVWR